MLADGIYGWTNTAAREKDLKDLKAAANYAKQFCTADGGHNYSGSGYLSESGGASAPGLFIPSSRINAVMNYFCSGYAAYNSIKTKTADAPKVAHAGVRQKTSVRLEDTQTAFVVEIALENFLPIEGSSTAISAKLVDITASSGASVSIKGASYIYNDNPESEDYQMDLYNQIKGDMYNAPGVQEQLVKNNKGTAKVYVSFVLNHGALDSDSLGACNYNAQIKVDYTHPGALTGAILKANLFGMDISYFQRFVIFDPQSSTTQTVEPCSITCQTSNNLIPSVCEDGLVANELGNVVYSFREGYFSEKELVKTCILNNSDEALNTYKFESNADASILTDNPFCSMYCKEDYSFNLPYKRTVDNGRYFNIALDIGGKQNCYSTEIDSKLLNADLISMQKKLVEAYNTYIFYDTLLDSTPEADPDNTPSCDWVDEPEVSSEPCDWYCDDTCPVTCSDGSSGCTEPCHCRYHDTCYYCVGGCNSNTHDEAADQLAADSKKTYGYIKFDSNIFLTYNVVAMPDIDASEEAKKLDIVQISDIPDYVIDSTKLNVVGNKVVFGGNIQAGSASYTLTRTASMLTKDDYRAALLAWEPQPVYTHDYQKNTSGKGVCDSVSYSVNSSNGHLSTSGSNKYTFTNYDTDYNNQKDYITKERAVAISRIKQIIADIKAYVLLFNSCTGVNTIKNWNATDATKSIEWHTPYQFDPEFTYTYDEPNIKEYAPEQKWIELAKVIGKDKMLGFDKEIIQEGEALNIDGTTTTNPIGSTQVPKLNYKDYEDKTFFTDEKENSRTFCVGKAGDTELIDEEYNCKGTLIDVDSVKDQVYNLDVINFTLGDDANIRYDNYMKYYYTKVKYIRTTASAQAHFDTERVFYTSNPTGKIKVSDEKPEQDENNWSLVDGLPVSIQTPVGTYYYQILFDNIGTYYTTQRLGRIYGFDGSSLSQARSTKSVKPDDANIQIEPNGYACTYEVGEYTGPGPDGGHSYCVEEAEAYYVCSTTEFDKEKCVKKENRSQALRDSSCGSDEDKDCQYNINCCPYCEVTGGGLFNSEDIEGYAGESLLDFRPINLSALNPNNRDLGWNWKTRETGGGVNYNWHSGTAENVLMEQKAGVTISEIQSRVEITNIDVTSPGQIQALNDTNLEVTLTPKMITSIRQYNNDVQKEGSYNNQTLKCYDYILSITDKNDCAVGGFLWVPDNTSDPKSTGICTMPKIMCYSSFLDTLQSDFSEDIVSNRPGKDSIRGDVHEGSTTPYTSFLSTKSSELVNDSEYRAYNLHVESINNGYWTIFKYDSLDVDGDGVPDIGPSWK